VDTPIITCTGAGAVLVGKPGWNSTVGLGGVIIVHPESPASIDVYMQDVNSCVDGRGTHHSAHPLVASHGALFAILGASTNRITATSSRIPVPES
jgi:hypothetical protein